MIQKTTSQFNTQKYKNSLTFTNKIFIRRVSATNLRFSSEDISSSPLVPEHKFSLWENYAQQIFKELVTGGSQ